MPIDFKLIDRIKANDEKLTTVDVRYSQLTRAELTELVTALQHNTHVSHLDVSGNPLVNEDIELLGKPDLPFTTLVAAECHITDANALAKNNRLTELLMPSNQICRTGLSFFAENKTLKVLSLAGNGLADECAEILAQNTGLSALILSHNKVGVKGAQALALNKTLSILDLSYNEIRAEGASALAQNNQLTTLIVAGNNIASPGIMAFADNKHLIKLDLSYNDVNNTSLVALVKHPTLTHLNLGYNQITYEGAYILSQMTQLRYLVLCHNLLRDAGAAALAQIKSLEYLDVSGNRIGIEGAHALALNKSLRILFLNSNLVGDVGAVFLAHNRTLAELYLSYNNIGDAGAVAFSGNETLKVLSLNYNKIGEKGRQALLDNKSLTSLILSKEQPPEFTDENLDTIFSLTESFLCITDATGIIQFLNPAFSRVLGYTEEELLTKSFFDFFHPETKPAIEAQLSSTENPLISSFENRYRCQDGTFRIIRYTAHKKHNRLYVMGTDITEQRRAEKEFLLSQQRSFQDRLKEAEAYSARQTEFVAQLSHEIRNPLSGMYGLIELLKQHITDLEMILKELLIQPTLTEKMKFDHTIEEIRQSFIDMIACAEYQKAILNDNLDIVRITEKKLTLQSNIFEMKNAIRDVLTFLQPKAIKKGVKINVALPDEKEVWVKGDTLRFKQIIVNLLSNAIKYTESGGTIDINLTQQQSAPQQVHIKIEIIDTGIGINEETLNRLFQRFSQAAPSAGSQYEGAGLGLYLAKQLAKLMEGDITVKSSPGKGSVFSVEVKFADLSDQEKKSLEKKTKAPKPFFMKKPISKPTVKRTILVVEDNLINQKILEKHLKNAGYDCRLAEDGIAALAAYDLSPVDAILMDVMMPKMDGLAATQEIRRREKEKGLPRTPIIALTANVLERDQAQGFAAGVDAYMTKPYQKDEIYKKIEELIQVKKEQVQPEPSLQLSSSQSSSLV